MSSLQTIHSFRVLPLGPVSTAFRQALKHLASRGFADPSCVIVKTASGSRSGVTHAGGRYVHSWNPYAATVTAIMREQGIAPPSLPFVIAPGGVTLFHEWGHHVDHVWSREDHAVPFSFRWFSGFYDVHVRWPLEVLRARGTSAQEGKIESELECASVVPEWRRVAAELLADLFEDWMRSNKRVAWDRCDPEQLNDIRLEGDSPMQLKLLEGVYPHMVRARTYALFERGLRDPIGPPEVRGELFGRYTESLLADLRAAIEQVRSEVQHAPKRHSEHGF